MKNILLIVLALICYSAHAQKWGAEFGVGYNFAQPTGMMGHIINRGHGAAAYFGVVTPDKRFALGADLNFAIYGHDKSRQEYTFDDGSVAPMDIIVDNSFANIMAYAKWYPQVNGVVHPYLIGKLGYSAFTTDLNIYDPDDFDHCEPVDSEVLYEDGTMMATIGGGLKLDLSSMFKKLEEGKFFLDASLNMTRGGQVRYMHEDAHVHHHGTPADSDDVTAKFINTQTQVVHEHHVGYLYGSPVQMADLRVGFSMRISR